MEKESLGLGMVSGICFSTRKRVASVIVVQDESGKPLVNGQCGWGLPGGKIEEGESPADALFREWKEEVGTEENIPIIDEDSVIVIPRTGDEGPYKQYLIPVRLGSSPAPLRKTGCPGETGPPTWISLQDITMGEIPVFWTHWEIIMYYWTRPLARYDKEAAFIATHLAKKLGIEL
ncbi:NUDIX hydrolase [Patescibacteria group bacterium]|nr:NUDIX hydrolase [Patescibacteria group bacterium]MBU2633516.1 NUDIX hydrolase [Patescibacteria group bacterium]